MFKRVAPFAVGLVLALGLAGAAAGQTSGRDARQDTSGQNGSGAAKRVDNAGSKTVTVPYLYGHNRADADAMTRAAGLKPKFGGPTADNASVINQSVPAGREAPRGMTLVIRMGLAEAYARAPQLVGLNRAAASARSDASGLKPIFYGATDPGAVVASQSLPAGQQIARGSYIQLQMRAGPEQVTAPRFVGLSVEDARALASTKHLRPVFSGDTQAGALVTGQSPAEGQEVAFDSVVQLQAAVQQVRTPPLLKRSRAAAEARAAKVGLVLDASGDQSNRGLVVRQTPAAGALVAPGSHVQVVMAAPAVPPVGSTGPGSTGPATVARGPDTTNITSAPVGPAGVTVPVRKDKGGGLNGLMIGGAAAAVVAGAIVLAVRRRPGPPLQVPVDPEPRRRPDSPPPVTYAASMDSGRPTVRLASEPTFAGLALSLTRAEEDHS